MNKFTTYDKRYDFISTHLHINSLSLQKKHYMKTYFSTFSDSKISQDALIKRISLSVEESIPDDIVSHFSIMFDGEGPIFTKINIFRDTFTDNFYGIVFSSTEKNETQSKLVLSVAMMDERLKCPQLLGRLFQSMINDFCNQNTNKETFIQWGDDIHICRYSEQISETAIMLSGAICK